jgi:hypothetical protein
MRRKNSVLLPKICSRRMQHRILERPNAAVLFVFQGTMNGTIESPGRNIRLHASIDGVWVVLVEPSVELRYLLRGKSSDSALDILNRGPAHNDLSLFYTQRFRRE